MVTAPPTRAGQIHVLVADLPGGRHGLSAACSSAAGNERLDKIKEAQHLARA